MLWTHLQKKKKKTTELRDDNINQLLKLLGIIHT